MDNNSIPVIGKAVIESLTTGMYEDCRFIYREYIQNSADQIDKAIQQGILTKDDEAIHIQVSPEMKSILIEDNATGVPNAQVVQVLQDIAQSTKKIGTDKGFRGIGRLGGLAYCEKLIFETSYKGESIKSILIWDAKKLREIINNREFKEHATEVIRLVTSFKTEKESVDSHYFKVVLENVDNEELLNKKDIEDYLSMVAPVAFSNSFLYRRNIYDELQKDGLSLDEYKIFLNGDPIKKAYTSIIYTADSKGQKQRCDDIFDIQYFKEKDQEGKFLYWGWYGLSTFQKVIEKNCNIARGLRLRKHNIQIGLEDSLMKLHRENRGNHYFFGEVHVFSTDLIPNARRDYFVENHTYKLFEKKLKNFFHCELYKLYHDASAIRNAAKDIQNHRLLLEELTEKEKNGFHTQEEKVKLVQKAEEAEKKAEEAKKKLERLETKKADSPVGKIMDRVKKSIPDEKKQLKPESLEKKEETRTNYFTDKYSWLPKSERKLLSKVFSIIDKVLSKELAKNLIDKLDEEITAKK